MTGHEHEALAACPWAVGHGRDREPELPTGAVRSVEAGRHESAMHMLPPRTLIGARSTSQRTMTGLHLARASAPRFKEGSA